MINRRLLGILASTLSTVVIPLSRADTCPSGEHWVRAHFRRAYVRASGTQVSAADVKAHCAANPDGYGHWRPKVRDTRPSKWPHSAERTKKWNDDEVERLLEALGDLPSELGANSIAGIYRMERSKFFPNVATSRPGEIVLYDSAFESSKNLARILSHELAHELYRGMSREDIRSYFAATNWFNVSDTGTRPTYIRRKEGFVREDGKSGPDEDFANNIEYFLFSPAELKAKTPNAHIWIQGRFGDTFSLGKGK